MHLGAGRRQKGDVIDMGAGISLVRKIGDFVNAGDRIALLYKGAKSQLDKASISHALSLAEAAVELSPLPVPNPREILAILDEDSL